MVYFEIEYINMYFYDTYSKTQSRAIVLSQYQYEILWSGFSLRTMKIMLLASHTHSLSHMQTLTHTHTHTHTDSSHATMWVKENCERLVSNVSVNMFVFRV